MEVETEVANGGKHEGWRSKALVAKIALRIITRYKTFGMQWHPQYA